jgi:ketosteroid isomerase-like protein
MKNRINHFVLVASLIFFTSCGNTERNDDQRSNKQLQQEETTLKEKIEKINKVIEKAMLSGDFDSILPYYTDDIIISPPLRKSVEGVEAIKEIYQENKKIGLKYHSFSGTVEKIWECSDNIYERGTFGNSLSSNDHPKPVAYYGSYFTIWQKEKDGSVKIKYLIYNLDFNPFK